MSFNHFIAALSLFFAFFIAIYLILNFIKHSIQKNEARPTEGSPPTYSFDYGIAEPTESASESASPSPEPPETKKITFESKMLTIDNCEDCKYIWLSLRAVSCCGLMNNRECYGDEKCLIDNENQPSWCPLPKATQELILAMEYLEKLSNEPEEDDGK